MKDMVRQYKLIIFILFTYVASWACWLSVFEDLKPSLFEFSANTLLLFLLGAYAPSLCSVLLTGYLDGPVGVRALFKRLVMWKVGVKWNLIAFAFGPVIYAIAIFIYAINDGFLGATNYGLLPWIPVVFLVSVFLGPLAEELGWRGFVLPCLDTKNKPALASIVMGIIWAAWHTPLFWAVIGTSVSGFPVTIESVGLFFLASIGSCFFYVWMFNKTAGSVFIAVMIHLSWNASGNITGMLFPEMTAAHKLDFYLYPVAIVWACVLAASAYYLLAKGKIRAIEISPK